MSEVKRRSVSEILAAYHEDLDRFVPKIIYNKDHSWSYRTVREQEQITKGNLCEFSDSWTIRGRGWKTWRGFWDYSDDRLYRSPEGRYYLGSIVESSWGAAEWEKASAYDGSPPFSEFNDARWIAHPLQAAPPYSLRYAPVWPGTREYEDPSDYEEAYDIVRKNPDLMRVVAVAWFLDRGSMDWSDVPTDLHPLAHEMIKRREDDLQRVGEAETAGSGNAGGAP